MELSYYMECSSLVRTGIPMTVAICQEIGKYMLSPNMHMLPPKGQISIKQAYDGR